MMNERQRKFAEYYAVCGNATRAAIDAGYSERTARSQGQRLLTNADIANYITQLQDDASSERIATLEEVRAFWSERMRDVNEKTADRIRASELLAKSFGAFLHRESDDSEEVHGEYDGEDVVIYLPAIDRDSYNLEEDG